MSARKRLSEFQKRARKVLTSGSTPVQPASSLPGAGSSAVGPGPDPPIVWRCLKSFLRVLDNGSDVFGPLKTAMGELIRFIEIHEVGLCYQQRVPSLNNANFARVPW